MCLGVVLMCFVLGIHWVPFCFNTWKLLPLSTSLKFFLLRSPMSFYSYVHYIVYHFSYILSSKQCLKNIELFPSWYPNLLIFFSLFLWLTLLKILYGWFFLPFSSFTYWYFFFFFFYLATLPFSLWLFFLISIVSSCFNCHLDTDDHFKHLY